MTSKSSILLLVIFCISLTFSHCSKEEDFHVENLNHNIIMILGHSGMGDLYKYPNNSLESIIPVLGIGADGTEVDVQMTKDSVLILFHDETLDMRTKCGGYTSPYDYNWSEIKACNYNTAIDYIPLYTVDEVFSSLSNVEDLYFSFDCKLNAEHFYDKKYRIKFLNAIKRVCEKYKLSKNVFIEGDLDFLLTAKELCMINKGFVIGSTIDEATENNIFGIGLTIDASIEEVEYAHQKGLYVMMWGAKTDAGNKQAIRLNPDILQTDKPIPILMLFDRFNYDYKIP